MHSDFKAIKDVLRASNGERAKTRRNEEAQLHFFGELSACFFPPRASAAPGNFTRLAHSSEPLARTVQMLATTMNFLLSI